MLTFLGDNVIFFLSSLAIGAGLVFVSAPKTVAPTTPVSEVSETTSTNINIEEPTSITTPTDQPAITTPPVQTPRPKVHREDDGEEFDD